MTHKNYISILLFLLVKTGLSAQKDTTYQTIRQETGAYTAPVIETPADRLFRTKVPARLMFKMNLGDFLFDNRYVTPYGNSVRERVLIIGSEYKLSPAFSVGVHAGVSLGLQKYGPYEGKWYHFSTAGLEARWYHDMEKRIKSGQSADNFGGKYLGLETAFFDDIYNNDNWSAQRISLRYGVQQRFMRNGYFDISIGAGVYSRSLNPADQTTFSLDQRVSAGLAAFLPRLKSPASGNNICEVLHCQDEQYKMLKINIFDAINFQSNGRFFNFSVEPGIAYEQKIGKSPFAVEAEVGAAYQKMRFGYAFTGQSGLYSLYLDLLRWNAAAELRYYYTLRKRILKGTSGNNLSGAFFGLQIQHFQFLSDAARIKKEGDSNPFNEFILTGDYRACNLIWGYQQRLFNHGFIQVKFGAGSTFGGYDYRYNITNQSFTKLRRNNELNLVSELRVGFAF